MRRADEKPVRPIDKAAAARRASWASRELPAGLPGRVRKHREARGWTQAELAEAAGLSTIGVRQLESGKRNPSLETIGRIADALDITVDELREPRTK